MTSNEEQDYVSGGSSKIPVFTEPALFQQWLLEVNLWEFTQTKHKDKLGAKLLTAQTDPQVKRVMLEVPIADIKTEAGLQKILDRMTTYYGKKSESLAWAVFSSWFQGSRPKGETVEVFTRKFLSLFAQVETHDKEVKCSDRMLAMVLLLQLNTTKKDRAAILAFMKDEISPMAVVHAVHHLYDGELPWSGKEKMDETEVSMFTTRLCGGMRTARFLRSGRTATRVGSHRRWPRGTSHGRRIRRAAARARCSRSAAIPRKATKAKARRTRAGSSAMIAIRLMLAMQNPYLYQ